MGKAGYKKFKKQEKARVKLKGNKTILPKGQNITDTNFKVKKIIVKGQLKEHSDLELLTKKRLSFKELLSRLNHHNVSMRQDALTGLKELISSHGSEIVQTNLSTLLQATMSLTIDREHDVRKETLKLLSVIFENVTEEELSALFPVVITHLSCAMTHIEPSVRSDSLLLLDGMLAAIPRLTAAHTPTLLPHFLDLISHQGSSQARSLSLNLDGKVTSDKWRCRVIGRLNRLFSVIIKHTEIGQVQTVRSTKWKDENRTFLGLYSPFSTRTSFSGDVKYIQTKDYATMLMPLLLDAFTEAVPKQLKEDSETSCVVKLDVAALLQCIVEVILNIWNLLKLSSQKKSLIDWFKKTWGEPIVTRMIQNHFPFSVPNANSRKRQRDTDKMLAALQVSEPSSSLLNLQLCLLVFLLTRPCDLWTQCIQYIKRSLRGGLSHKPEESSILCQCLEAASDQQGDTDMPSMLQVITKSGVLDNVDKPINRRAFDYLTSVALLPSHQLHEDKYFTTWLDSLPCLLCKATVTLATVRSLAAIAARNSQAFMNSLDGWIEEIFRNLPYLKVVGDADEEGRKLIIDLFYWVKDWDQELALNVKNTIKQGSLGPILTAHLVDVLRFGAENTEDVELKNLLENVLAR